MFIFAMQSHYFPSPNSVAQLKELCVGFFGFQSDSSFSTIVHMVQNKRLSLVRAALRAASVVLGCTYSMFKNKTVYHTKQNLWSPNPSASY